MAIHPLPSNKYAYLQRKLQYRARIINAYAIANDINLRVTQLPMRTLILPTDANLRVTQLPMRTLILPTDANLRVTQVSLRVLRLNNPSNIWPYQDDELGAGMSSLGMGSM